MRENRLIIGTMTAILASTSLAACVGPSETTGPVERLDSQAELYLPACETEDANGCVWIANEHGNRVGTSFYADLEGNVTPVTDDAARAMVGMAVTPAT